MFGGTHKQEGAKCTPRSNNLWILRSDARDWSVWGRLPQAQSSDGTAIDDARISLFFHANKMLFPTAETFQGLGEERNREVVQSTRSSCPEKTPLTLPGPRIHII